MTQQRLNNTVLCHVHIRLCLQMNHRMLLYSTMLFECAIDSVDHISISLLLDYFPMNIWVIFKLEDNSCPRH